MGILVVTQTTGRQRWTSPASRPPSGCWSSRRTTWTTSWPGTRGKSSKMLSQVCTFLSSWLIDTTVAAKKQGKKGEFAEPAARLIQAGGFASLLIFPLLKQLWHFLKWAIFRWKQVKPDLWRQHHQHWGKTGETLSSWSRWPRYLLRLRKHISSCSCWTWPTCWTDAQRRSRMPAPLPPASTRPSWRSATKSPRFCRRMFCGLELCGVVPWYSQSQSWMFMCC